MYSFINFSFEELCLLSSLGTDKREKMFIELQKLYNSEAKESGTKEVKNTIRNCIKKLECISDFDFQNINFEAIREDVNCKD